MSPQNEAERLTRVETRLETIESAILRMEAKFDAWQVNFVSKEMLAVELRVRDERIDRLEFEKKESKQLMPTWLSVVCAAGLLVVTIISVLKGVK